MRNFIAMAAILIAAAGFIATSDARAQAPRYVATVVDLEIAPGELDKFLAALRTNAAATIKEPGCLRYEILQSPGNPTQILIFEAYENEAAVQAHRAADHFKAYQAATKDLVVKRQSRPMVSVASFAKGN
jgi:autoinducer 2-degrading protein